MIWIIAGTKDAREIIGTIIKTRKNFIVTTASEYGKFLLKDINCEVFAGKLNIKEMNEFINKKRINQIIDLSHPYAENVSKNAIELSKKVGIDYIRFERERLTYNTEMRFDTYEEIINHVNTYCIDDTVMSAMGSNHLDKLKNIKADLYIRILPIKNSIEKAYENGFKANKIIAIQGPISKNLNIELMKNYNIKYLLSKESGICGGELEKIEACRECGVEVLLLKRPQIDYPKVYYKIKDLLGAINDKTL